MPDGADVLVLDGWDEYRDVTPQAGVAYVLRLSKEDIRLMKLYNMLTIL